MSRSDLYNVRSGDHRVDSHVRDKSEKKFSSTFLIILVSLLFVALLGGALIGALISGDPSNGFFMTVLAASAIAISIAILMTIRYFCQRRETRYADEYNVKANDHNVNIQPTFTHTADDEEEGGYSDNRGRFISSQEYATDDFGTINARSMAPGDISAMSPSTYMYDMQTYNETQSQYTMSHIKDDRSYNEDEGYSGPFDFSSVVSSTRRYPPRGEDPPEEFGENNRKHTNVPKSRDPSAALATTTGIVVEEETEEEGDKHVEETEKESKETTEKQAATEKKQMEQQIKEWEQKTVRSKSSQKIKNSKDIPPPPPPPRSTKSSRSANASEAGSAVSSLFLKPFSNMFSKKKTQSEAGQSSTINSVKASKSTPSNRRTENKLPPSRNTLRPPMASNKVSVADTPKQELETIGGRNNVQERYAPSTFSIPPPRRVPSTPGASSQAPSEFRSVAASSVFSTGAASSTFDAEAHARALRRAQQQARGLGAAYDDMSIYYEDDESMMKSQVESKASPHKEDENTHRVGYDVLAPPGPLGMVVDTVEEGCVVHSLKKNSALRGLLNPGDLIVELDGINVRKMDAATLTKLMAKKSQQEKRKFTLIASDQL